MIVRDERAVGAVPGAVVDPHGNAARGAGFAVVSCFANSGTRLNLLRSRIRAWEGESNR